METKYVQIEVSLDLEERLKKLAKKDRRSKTAEALVILEEAVSERLAQLDAIQRGDTQINLEAIGQK